MKCDKQWTIDTASDGENIKSQNSDCSSSQVYRIWVRSGFPLNTKILWPRVTSVQKYCQWIDVSRHNTNKLTESLSRRLDQQWVYYGLKGLKLLWTRLRRNSDENICDALDDSCGNFMLWEEFHSAWQHKTNSSRYHCSSVCPSVRDTLVPWPNGVKARVDFWHRQRSSCPSTNVTQSLFVKC